MQAMLAKQKARKRRRRPADGDLQKLVDEWNVPLIHLRYRCSRCRTRLTDWVVTSTYGGRPAWNRDGGAQCT
jgi:hypothetical protein